MTDNDNDNDRVPDLEARFNDAFEAIVDFWESIPDEAKQKFSERAEMQLEQGHYDAELRTPDGGVFQVGPVFVWGKSLSVRETLDIPIEKVPPHLRDSGLGECELTLYSSEGIPLLTGPLHDDGNRQDGLNQICVAVEYADE